jgi:Flp pilus assembly protein TadD
MNTLSHYNPAALNEYAASQVKSGDLGTARIMLERAARIAPYNPRIVANLNALNAHMAKQSGTTPKIQKTSSRNAPRITMQFAPPPEIPPLWPAK